MNYDEATLLGILYTDGCLSKKGKNCWRFYVSNTSWQIIQAFKDSMMELFDLPESRVRISQEQVNSKPFYRAVVDSSEIGWELTRKYGTFRTQEYSRSENGSVYPAARLPLLQEVDLNLVARFLKVAFSCDGGVNLYVARSKYLFLIRNAYLACKHPTLRLDYQVLLSKMGVKVKIIKDDRRLLIQGRENLERFAERIGFLEGVRVTQKSTFWQDWEKNRVLRLALASYGNPKLIFDLPQFSPKAMR